jgi:hypothetical protein
MISNAGLIFSQMDRLRAFNGPALVLFLNGRAGPAGRDPPE